MEGLIYKCTCLCNNKIYIGQTIQTFNERRRQHIKEAFNEKYVGYTYHFHRALRKYGLDNFKWEILQTITADNIDDLVNCLDLLEIQYIEQYNSYKNGYNSTLGGNSPTRRNSKIDVYLEDGTLIETLDSARQTSQKYEIPLQSVWNVCRKVQNFSYKNGIRYIFRYQGDTYSESEISINKNIATDSLVLMYNLDGFCIKTFLTPKQAEEYFNISKGAVSRCCIRNSKFVFIDGSRYIFKYANDDITKQDILDALKVKSDPKCRVIAIDYKTQEVIGTFETMSEGAKKFNTTVSKISEVCSGKRRSSGKYNGNPILWKKL